MTDPEWDVADGPGHVLEVYDPGRYEGRVDNDDDFLEPERPDDDILARVRNHYQLCLTNDFFTRVLTYSLTCCVCVFCFIVVPQHRSCE